MDGCPAITAAGLKNRLLVGFHSYARMAGSISAALGPKAARNDAFERAKAAEDQPRSCHRMTHKASAAKVRLCSQGPAW